MLPHRLRFLPWTKQNFITFAQPENSQQALIQMYQLLKYSFILFFLLVTTIVVGQNYTLSYRVLDNEDGLLGSRVSSFHQDKRGFTWMVTQRGIARYDGHQFQWFTEMNSNLRGLPEGNKTPFIEDDEGNLWSCSIGKIDVINTETLEIQPLEEKLNKDLPFKGRIININQTKDNYIIFESDQNSKWYRYHSSTGFVELNFIPNNIKSVFVQGSKIWVRTPTNIALYDYKTGKKRKEASTEAIQGIKVIQNYNLEQDLVWRCTNNKLEILELKKEGLEKVVHGIF